MYRKALCGSVIWSAVAESTGGFAKEDGATALASCGAGILAIDNVTSPCSARYEPKRLAVHAILKRSSGFERLRLGC